MKPSLDRIETQHAIITWHGWIKHLTTIELAGHVFHDSEYQGGRDTCSVIHTVLGLSLSDGDFNPLSCGKATWHTELEGLAEIHEVHVR